MRNIPTIRDDIPVPDVSRGTWIHIFERMEKGHSFEFDLAQKASVYACARSYSKRYKEGKWKFCVRKVKDSEGKFTDKCRLWRLE